MGSDLYMERQNWSPRPPLVEWTSATDVKIQTDGFYHGYNTVYESKVTPEVEILLKGLGIKLPKKPKPEDDPLIPLAIALHDALCRWNHTDGCAWFYETGWTKEKNNPLAESIWTGKGREHARWLENARKVKRALPDLDDNTIVKVITAAKGVH